ncbi:MAG: PilZ domain-containing protein [Candidatus Sulfotelmatobacter sp.]
MDVRSQLGTGQTPEFVEARRYPRFKLEVGINVYSRDCPVVRGHTVDISESGISAMLREEIPLGGAVVRLEFTLPLGKVEVLALVRQRNAFRYGFQFVEGSSADDVIGRTCRRLAVESSAEREGV